MTFNTRQKMVEVKSLPTTTTIENSNNTSSPIDVDALPDEKYNKSGKLERDLSCNVFVIVVM